MARANRHFISGQVWHLTHRCHKREFLLKFAKDRLGWMRWLYEARKRFGLLVLDYVVTCNHVHLIVHGNSGDATIPRSIQLLAGRSGQQYNQRKKRKGAFWDDRYHATAIESGEHLLRCIVYVDMNMVRAGVVSHPDQWPHGGYSEIQCPHRKNILIDYETLGHLAGFENFNEFQAAHRRWVDEALADGNKQREDCWTRSIAVGSRSFVEGVKVQMGHFAIGRRIWRTAGVGFELRETQSHYMDVSDAGKRDIDCYNQRFWNLNNVI